MATLPILIAPDSRLKKRAAPVAGPDGSTLALLETMLETMYKAPGVGLAAPQIGVLQRLVVIDVAREGEPPAPLRLINPEIVWRSDEQVRMEEGCLSLPDEYAEIDRPARVRATWIDETGARQEREADGLLARCLQHEIDHLDGVLFVDHLSALRRSIILRRMQKLKRERAAS